MGAAVMTRVKKKPEETRGRSEKGKEKIVTV